MKIQGVVVFYNPTLQMINNISLYINALDRLYVIDNSDNCEINITSALNNISNLIEYKSMGGNKGIAAALNAGCRIALESGAHWVLTMDQDSSYEPDGFNIQVNALKEIQKDQANHIGILSSHHLIEFYQHQFIATPTFETDFVMTSGNLINLSAYSAIDGFRDEFFIDEVDSDFCKRLKNNNYKILVANEAKLNHYLGNTRKHTFCFYSVMCSHHSYIRRYYITRNRLYMGRLYPELRREYQLRNTVSLLKVIILEKDKLRKIRAFLDGFLDDFKRQYSEKKFTY